MKIRFAVAPGPGPGGAVDILGFAAAIEARGFAS
jgi:hypothetical protein